MSPCIKDFSNQKEGILDAIGHGYGSSQHRPLAFRADSRCPHPAGACIWVSATGTRSSSPPTTRHLPCGFSPHTGTAFSWARGRVILKASSIRRTQEMPWMASMPPWLGAKGDAILGERGEPAQFLSPHISAAWTVVLGILEFLSCLLALPLCVWSHGPWTF